MPASDRPPKASGSAVLEPPRTRPPAPLSAEQDAPRDAPLLVVIHARAARDLGRRFVLHPGPVLVGRGAENHVVLEDASVSPRHARLERRDAAWWCVDDGSTDGVYVDDRRTTGGAPLAHGTRIGIGSTIFKFLSGGQPEEQYREEIYRMTVYDGLTQAYGQRHLVEALDKETVRGQRQGSALALLMIEVDDLAAVDGAGGLSNAGDHVLRQVAGVLRRSLPREAFLARHGEERLVMVLPGTTPEEARTVADGLCEEVASTRMDVGARELRVTVSIGGAQLRGDDRASADILARATRALEVAKGRG